MGWETQTSPVDTGQLWNLGSDLLPRVFLCSSVTGGRAPAAECPRGRTYESAGAAIANHHRDGALRQRTRTLPVREGGVGRAASFGSLGGRIVPRLRLGLWG